MEDIPFSDKGRTLLRLLTFLTVFAAGAPSLAQDEASIAAVVNEDSISTVDLAHRTDLVMFATGMPRTPQAARDLRPRVLKMMIDEALQLQAAKAAGLVAKKRGIDEVLANMERENKLAPGGLGDFLASKGVELSALRHQVEVSLSWRNLVERKFRNQAVVGEDEIDDALAQIQENQGKPRNLVSEIFLAVDETNQDAQVGRAAIGLIEQLRGGAGFDALARAFSQNAAAATGGDLGWLVPGQLDPQLEQELARMQPGQVGGPFRTLDGYHIIALRDRRLPGGSSPNQVTVDLRQINLPLSSQAKEDEVRAVVQAATQIRDEITTCDSLATAALPSGVKVANIGRVRIGDLAAPLQPALMGLQTNQMSQPLRGPRGVMLFMVCARESETTDLPSREIIKGQLAGQKMDLLARRYLRDLRRAAFLDIRE